MNWLIVVLVVLLLISSVMWVMPSPYQRMQARLRQEAMRRGLQVQMVRLTFPRQEGEVAGDERSCIAYRLNRKPTKTRPGNWHLFKARAIATRGLPDGWCWSKGEGVLEDAALEVIGEVLQLLPKHVFSVESTPIALSIYWDESGEAEALDHIHQGLEKLNAAGL